MGAGRCKWLVPGRIGLLENTTALSCFGLFLLLIPPFSSSLWQIKRNLFKNILHYMTINVDMSSLFTQMIIAATTTSAQDLVLKKMLYLYICTYAQQKPDLTLLAINTLTKDCGDSDPTIRGLALRSLCSLRVPNLVEYLLTPLKNGIGDRDAYVRRTAVLGVLKVIAFPSTSSSPC